MSAESELLTAGDLDGYLAITREKRRRAILDMARIEVERNQELWDQLAEIALGGHFFRTSSLVALAEMWPIIDQAVSG